MSNISYISWNVYRSYKKIFRRHMEYVLPKDLDKAINLISDDLVYNKRIVATAMEELMTHDCFSEIHNDAFTSIRWPKGKSYRFV